MEHFNNYLTVDLDILQENFQIIRKLAGVPVMAVIKADAYGHGAVTVAKRLDAEFFGVSSVSEALELRRAGVKQPILILGHTPVSYLGGEDGKALHTDTWICIDTGAAMGKSPMLLCLDTMEEFYM